MLPAMHRLDGGRSAASNTPLDLSASLSRKEKRTTVVDSDASEADPNAVKAPVIIATSQQSRFHTVTFDEFGKNVLLNQFTLAIGSAPPKGSGDPVGVVELLRDTQLKLNYGSRYGLVGPNGIGKSTLLTALADGLVEGLPASLKILYVNQLDTSSLTPESAQQSVLQTVLSADTRVSELQHKIDVLQRAELLHALLTIQVMEAEQAQEAASKIAIKRSGMLGKDARLRLLEVEHKVADLRQRLQFTTLSDDGEHESVVAANETEVLHEIHKKMEEFQQALKVLDEASMEARARRILASMGVDPNKQDAPLSSLSGGWQVRILLARVLFMEPDFLLLDEPTNHLDMPSILWLKNYLLTLEQVLASPVTLVVVSHDRFFLNAVTDETIFFRGYDKTLAYYDGNYDAFEEAMASKRQFNARLQTKLDKKTEQMSAMVSKIAQQAARSKDDKKLQVAASKKKKMDRIGNERSAKGTRFKLNRDRIGYFLTDRDQAEDQAKYDETEGGASASSAWRILSSSPPQIRNLTKLDNTTMISLENVSFQYDTADTGATTEKPKTPLVVENLNLTINYGDKVVLVGRNGAGKTTFMKLLSRGLGPKRGKVEYFHGARVASLMQHNVEDLKRQEWSRGLAPLELLRSRLQADEASSQTVAAELGGSSSASDHANDGKMRGHLSSFGITGGAAVAVPLHALSGGQLVRVGLAWATFPYPPHVLLLDEPTNHLDMSTIQLLGEALRKYQGAVVLISHDLHFLDILTNGSQRAEDSEGDDDDEACGRVRVFEVSKKKGVVSLLPLERVEAYREKEERRNASLGRI
ncbi:ABC transporter [Phytophthora sojae]|uniref:ABC transporter n=1 Tax=Phytophthora sojae (strain P6497) TaxID=1094619 RepID=G4Z3H3_PHYSP|nr:ABC transporter [Phytophthora sojae]EGZ19345.1 ABC transporter [Phytophthora sojae]|eukprot:XP_009522062.1 ABC transporter [Phytophthora sojae]